MIDAAVSTCLAKRKPVYLEIACNLASAKSRCRRRYRSLHRNFPQIPRPSKPRTLLLLPNGFEPLHQARARGRSEAPLLPGHVAFLKLAEAIGCAVAVMPDAKGLFPEEHPSTPFGHVLGRGGEPELFGDR